MRLVWSSTQQFDGVHELFVADADEAAGLVAFHELQVTGADFARTKMLVIDAFTNGDGYHVNDAEFSLVA